MNRPCTIGWAMDHGPPTKKKLPLSLHIVPSSSWTMDRTATMDHESTMHHWMGHGPWTTYDKKFPFSLHIVASSSWTMDRTWTMDHESTMRHWMGHGQWTTYDKKSRSASTSWHPRLGPWTEDGAWTMNRPCTMDHEATMNPRNPWKPWIGIHDAWKL